MKTTIELPDELYRKTKAFAALTGQTVKDVITEALRAKLRSERDAREPRGWRGAFGKVPPRDAQRVQAIIDDELSRIDPEDWR